ncbi:hypothetical protein ACFC0M_31315 [Streptomyces sp. NPDC056149]|uniref:hypothetical protein n=1 Tax=Streptomyces sp. NPDC056149 TaxID=3345728 RepID=UPI0035D64611
MWFGKRQKVQGFGAVVLAMSFALAGCGTSSKQSAESVLPSAGSMPTELKTVTNKPSSTLPPKKCRSTADKPSGWCVSAVAESHVAYGNGDRSKRAVFDAVAYHNDTAAKKAFRKWKASIESHSSKYRILNGEKFGTESVAFVGTTGASRDDQGVVLLAGSFVGTVDYRGSGKQDAVDATLGTMSKTFAERMQKES